MTPTPRLSVVLPVRDAATTLPEALESLREQTFTDFEVVVVDDGSSDSSLRAAEAFASADSRFRVIGTPRRGLVAALGTGVSHARANWIARMDADDVSLPSRFERQVGFLERSSDVALVGCGVRMFPPERVGGGMLRYEAWLNGLTTHDEIVREVFVESPVAHPSVMFRREAFEAAGGYRDPGWPEDYDLWLRMLAGGSRFAKVPDVLLRWRESPTRASRVSPVYGRDRFLEAKARYLGPVFLRGKRSVVVWGAGPTGRRLVRLLGREGIRTRAFVDVDPRKVRRGAIPEGPCRGIPVRSPESLRCAVDRPLLAAVGSLGARERIRRELDRTGWTEGRDYTCVA